MKDLPYADIDVTETTEWLDAIEQVLQQDGSGRANLLIEKLINDC